MRIGLFADLHYEVIPDADRRIDELVHKFKTQKVDFVLELGDFCLTTDNKNILDKMKSLHVPVYYTIGNHNTDHQPLKDVLDYFGMKKNYYSFVKYGVKFIILDSNYIRIGNDCIPFEKKNYYKTKGSYPFIPEYEIEWLERELADEYPVVICDHHSLTNDFGHNGVINRERIRTVIEKNNRGGRKILLCLNGHDHGSRISVVNGIIYYGINSCAYFWQEYKENYCFDVDIHRQYPMLKNMILYDRALCSILDIDPDLNIRIFGMEGSYLKVTPEESGMPHYIEGVSVAPRTMSLTVESGQITLY